MEALQDSAQADGVDGRVAAALAVLGGSPIAQVADALEVEPELVARWTQQFVDGGRAEVLNRPAPTGTGGRVRFLTVLAHELRTPLTVIRGALDLARRTASDERVGEMLDAATRNAERLEALARVLGDTAAASLGQLDLAPVRLDLAVVAGEAAVAHGVQASGGGPIEVDADRERLADVIDDVLGALRGDAADVVVAASRSSTWAELAVRRRPALDPDDVLALLEPFDAGRDASAVTLGLYRARALVVAMGGQLGASGDEDETEIWLRLPLPSDPLPA